MQVKAGPGSVPQAMDPFGLALRDYLAGAADAFVTIVRSDGYRDEMSVAAYFNDLSDPGLIDPRPALDDARGPVLDVGAGAGRVSLYLQDRGAEVVALDISLLACEVMRQRGVRIVREGDLRQIATSSFQTILLIGAGIGMAGKLTQLEGFLGHLRSLGTTDGIVILDSLDVRETEDGGYLAYQAAREAAGAYRGDIRFAIEYRDQRGPEIGWLHVDAETLAEHAGRAGWETQVLQRAEQGHYLARLSQPGAA